MDQKKAKKQGKQILKNYYDNLKKHTHKTKNKKTTNIRNPKEEY